MSRATFKVQRICSIKKQNWTQISHTHCIKVNYEKEIDFSFFFTKWFPEAHLKGFISIKRVQNLISYFL